MKKTVILLVIELSLCACQEPSPDALTTMSTVPSRAIPSATELQLQQSYNQPIDYTRLVTAGNPETNRTMRERLQLWGALTVATVKRMIEALWGQP